MSSCIICSGKAGVFSKKAKDGVICKTCLSYVPVSIKLPIAETSLLQRKIEENKEKEKLFDTTASYEGVYIDSLHGLFCICNKGTKQAPAEYHDIYHVSELREVGIYCSNPRNVGTTENRVVCDIKMRVKTDDIFNDFVLVQNKKCSYKAVGGGKIEWNEPNELSMFRNMFNQMIDNEVFGLIKKLEKIHEYQAALSSEQRNIDWAKGIMFIGDKEDYNAELLKSRRNLLVKIFHPDRNEFADTEIAAMINQAYKVLSR